MKRSFFAGLILVIGFSFSGCNKKDNAVKPATTPNNTNQSNTPVLTLNTQTLSFSNSSGNNIIVVESNTSWSVTSNNSWITVSPGSGNNNGSFSVYVSTNTAGGSRGGSVTITSGGVSRTIAVSQSGNPTSGLKGSVTFWFQTYLWEEPLEFYFNGKYISNRTVSKIYNTDPGCSAQGTITIENLSYGTYSYIGTIYNHDGSVNREHKGSVTLSSPCATKLIR